MDFLEIAAKLALYFVPFLFSLCFHEYAHGWVAKLKGDPTAQMMGRLTLNPFAHADFIGTILLPAMAILTNLPFFGWANPVPVNPRYLKNPRKDMFWIAVAGPLSNVLLAMVGSLALVLFFRLSGGSAKSPVYDLLNVFMVVNLSLAFFNLIPVHPLDGGKVIARFLPEHLNRKMEEHQGTMSLVLFALLMMGGLKFLGQPVMWAHWQLLRMAEVLVF